VKVALFDASWHISTGASKSRMIRFGLTDDLAVGGILSIWKYSLALT